MPLKALSVQGNIDIRTLQIEDPHSCLCVPRAIQEMRARLLNEKESVVAVLAQQSHNRVVWRSAVAFHMLLTLFSDSDSGAPQADLLRKLKERYSELEVIRGQFPWVYPEDPFTASMIRMLSNEIVPIPHCWRPKLESFVREHIKEGLAYGHSFAWETAAEAAFVLHVLFPEQSGFIEGYEVLFEQLSRIQENYLHRYRSDPDAQHLYRAAEITYFAGILASSSPDEAHQDEIDPLPVIREF